MRVTSYDRVSSFMMSLVIGVFLGVISVVAYWYTHRPPPPLDLVPLELLEVSGGFEDGNPEDSWELESPDPEDPNASLEEESEELLLEEMLENVIELSDQATEQLEQVNADAARSSGKIGSATGTGGRPLGIGPGTGGVPREQRWYVRFSDERSTQEYAKQLDFFGIELGVLTPDGKLAYVSDLSKPRPQVRSVQSGKDEQRLYMTWQSGQRRLGDAKLVQKAGINVGRNTVIFHFYPKQIEQMLATLEQKYRNRPPQEIQRTYFLVRKRGNKYEFTVTRQSYL